jgi:hypothetical protein
MISGRSATMPERLPEADVARTIGDVTITEQIARVTPASIVEYVNAVYADTVCVKVDYADTSLNARY